MGQVPARSSSTSRARRASWSAWICSSTSAFGKGVTAISDLYEKKTQQESVILFEKLFPQVQYEASSMFFGDPLEVNLLGDGAQDVDCSTFDAFGMGDLCTSFSEPMVLREAQIFDAKAQIIYPLSSIYSIFHGYKARQEQVSIAQLETDILHRQLRVSFINLYAQALYLHSTIAFVEQLENRLAAHLKNIVLMVDNGLVHPIERNRIQIAQQELFISKQEAQSGYALLCHQLELLIGIAIEPVEITIPDVFETEEIQIHPKENLLLHQERAAEYAAKSSFGGLFPTVALIGGTTRTGGQGQLTPVSQNFIGISLQGDFSFTSKWMRHQQAVLDWEMTKKNMSMETKQLQVQRESAAKKIEISHKKRELAKQKIRFATENQKQIHAFYTQQLRTNAELLDAETELLEAQLYALQTDLDYLNDIVAYEYAIGKVPMKGSEK